MNEPPEDLDLASAWLRRSRGELKPFMDALGARLESLLPGQVDVERRKEGLLSPTAHVVAIVVRAESLVLELALVKGAVKARRARHVRGVTLSSADISVPQWLAQVRDLVRASADEQGLAAQAIYDFL